MAACEELSKVGIQVRCVTQPTTDDDAGRFLRNMHAVFAEHERGRLRSKLDKDLPFQERRRIVEALVAGITVESAPGETSPKVTVRYNFDPHFERYQKWGRMASLPLDDTGASSWRQRA